MRPQLTKKMFSTDDWLHSLEVTYSITLCSCVIWKYQGVFTPCGTVGHWQGQYLVCKYKSALVFSFEITFHCVPSLQQTGRENQGMFVAVSRLLSYRQVGKSLSCPHDHDRCFCSKKFAKKFCLNNTGALAFWSWIWNFLFNLVLKFWYVKKRGRELHTTPCHGEIWPHLSHIVHFQNLQNLCITQTVLL